MSVILRIARNTFREAVRDRLLTTILVFGAVIVASSVILAPLTLGEEDRIVRDLGLTAVNVFAMLLVIFVGTSLVYREVEQRTIYAMLTQPISRTQFLLGKYLGLYAAVFSSVAILGLFYILVVQFVGSGAMGNLVLAVGLVALEGAILTAVAVLFSTVASPFLSAVFTFLVYVAGHLAADLKLLAKHASAPGLNVLGDIFSVIVPALHAFHVRDNIISGMAIPGERLAWCVLATLLYSAAALATASLAFARRDFE